MDKVFSFRNNMPIEEIGEQLQQMLRDKVIEKLTFFDPRFTRYQVPDTRTKVIKHIVVDKQTSGWRLVFEDENTASITVRVLNASVLAEDVKNAVREQDRSKLAALN